LPKKDWLGGVNKVDIEKGYLKMSASGATLSQESSPEREEIKQKAGFLQPRTMQQSQQLSAFLQAEQVSERLEESR